MKVTQTDILSLIDDDGIGIRYVETVFDDGSAQKHIIITGHKIKYLVFQHLSFHLSVSHTYLHIRHEPVQDIVYGLKFLHPVMKKEYLSSPAQLIIYDLLYFIRVEKHYLCLHRDPVRRWSTYNRKVTCSKKRELQGSRNRSCRKGQCIH